MKTVWVCLEGPDGVFKTTIAGLLAANLRGKGYSVLETKEPGTPLIPLTMELRALALDAAYTDMTSKARSFIMQAIREIHTERLIDTIGGDYQFIIQDRGILSGWVYETAHLGIDGKRCGYVPNLKSMQYNKIIMLYNSSGITIQTAIDAKTEFSAGGDVIEKLPDEYHEYVKLLFDTFMYQNRDSGYRTDGVKFLRSITDFQPDNIIDVLSMDVDGKVSVDMASDLAAILIKDY